MKANPENFKVMFIHPPRSPDNCLVCLNINDFKIDLHNVTTLLGVSIDANLRFDMHINDICVKALMRVKRYPDVTDRIQIYESFIIANFGPLVKHVCGTVSAKKYALKKGSSFCSKRFYFRL